MLVYEDINGILGSVGDFYKASTIWNFWDDLEDFEIEEYKNQEEWYKETLSFMRLVEIY